MYPSVLSEQETLRLVTELGMSIARYGDGELKLMYGHDCVSQRTDGGLQKELRTILCKPSRALACIPRLDRRSPKLKNWSKLAPKFEQFIFPKAYGSSFVTRPDSAPWINTVEYFDTIQNLWCGQAVSFIGNGLRSLTADFLLSTGAQHVDWIECPYRDAYTVIDELEKQAMALPNQRVILCVGPTATCLAERLAKKGKQGIDLGHIGMFWRRYGEFFVEQREINKDTGKVEPNP